MKMVYGAHVSISNGFLGAAMQSAEEYGANAMQIFIKSPRGGGSKFISDEESKEFKTYCKQAGMKFIVAHCSYLLNFAKPPAKNKWALDLLINDVECVHKLGGDGVVLHIGKYLDMKQETAWKNVVKSIHAVLDATKDTKVSLLLETTAGQGTEIGFRFDELAELYKKIDRSDRVQFCVDTCHIFAAGYDIRTPEGVKKTFLEWNKLIGVKYIKCIHFNDSKKTLGSRVDRHAVLDGGEIGKKGLLAVIAFAKKNKIPMILETPEDTRTHGEELEIFRSWL
jgi:deoxyribonuclease-4